MTPGATTIRIPFLTTIKRHQSNPNPSYERGRRVPDVLGIHLGSGHHTDSGRRFHDAQDSDSSSRRNLTLNPFESCDRCDGRVGCNGPGVEFYECTKLRQPNDTSTGHIQDEYREQFRRSLGQYCVNTLGGARVNTLRGARSNTRRGVRVNIVSISTDEIGSTSASSDVFEAIS
jgi:hypothetical protein